MPAEARGWKRGFSGFSPRWNNSSPATIFETAEGNDYVDGIAVALTDIEIERLDPFEGYPSFYNRTNLSLVTYFRNSYGEQEAKNV